MIKKRSLGINAILNITRTILALVAPLITYPYVSRILGANNLGSVNYTNSIIQYFVLFSGLGISTYGIREGAKKRDNLAEINRFVSECFTINIIFTLLSYIVFFSLLIIWGNENQYFTLFIIQSFLILFNTIGIDWVNTVFEDYFYITIRTIIIQILSICLTFLLIHNRNDYLFYAIITVTTTGVVSILNWIHYKKNLSIKLVKNPNFKEHLNPILIFFSNKLAVTLYVSADTTMLGAMVGEYSVGIYSVSVKLYTIIKNLLAAVYAVFIPRLSYTLGKCDYNSFKQIYSDLISIMTLLIFPAAIGLICLSKNIILLLFGYEYLESYLSLSILSLAIIFAIYGGLVSAVFDVVMGLEKIALQATFLAATLNIGINLLILSSFKQNGAAFTTLLAEAVTFLYCLIRSTNIFKYINVKSVLKDLLQSLLGCFEIIVVVKFFCFLLESNLLICVFSFLTCIILYYFTLVVLKNRHVLVFNKYLKNKFGIH